MVDVVIIGGGVAGLVAAGECKERGADVVVVEARTRAGGRVHTLRGDGWPAPVEEGAEFVHGRDKVLARLLKRAKLHADEQVDRHWLVGRDGKLRDGDDVWQAAMPLLEDDSVGAGKPDRSMAARIAAARDVDAAARDLALAYVEGFHAAAATRVSARAITEQQHAAEDVHGDELRRVREGYDGIIGRLVADVGDERVHLGARATRVIWRRGRVEVALRATLDDAPLPSLTARAAIVTLPLGVLQARPGVRALTFAPSLPAAKRRAIEALAMGDVVKVAFRFREPWWHELERRVGTPLSFVHERRARVPTWWRPLPFEAPMLVGWAAGPAARRLSGKRSDIIARTALSSLAHTTRTAESRLRELLQAWHVVDWSRDPFAAGAYSWVPVGADDEVAALAAPVDDTLFFAGEATNADGASGTVHGALATGRRTAAELLDGRARSTAR